jgi:diguanylate cyclase (GGDEF)-like protein
MVVDNGHVGLHGLPGPVDPTVGRTVVKLCEVALRLDVALHDAAHDPLTGLLNRRSFEEQLAAACARSERYRWPFALLLLDVDGFKAVNDRFGHATGDAMLKAIGRALTQRVRGGDAAARIGGDEFAMILANAREVDTEGIATRVAAVVSAAVPSASVTVSVGTALAPLHGTSIESLYHQADTAMYDQKARLP